MATDPSSAVSSTAITIVGVGVVAAALWYVSANHSKYLRSVQRALKPAAREARRTSTHVQSLLFPRSRFTPSSARSWARRHGYVAKKVDVTSDYVRLRQKPPGMFKHALRTVSFGGSGIKAVVGR